MPFWRAHPIRFAALLGAIFGFLDTLVVEIEGVLHHNHSAVVPLFIPTPGGARLGAVPTASILLIEVAANVLAWAFLFALFTAIVVWISRAARALLRR